MKRERSRLAADLDRREKELGALRTVLAVARREIGGLRATDFR